MKKTLLIFVKNPVYGKVKTRLAATAGNEKALLVYQNLIKYTAAITCNLPVKKTVYYSDFIGTEDYWDEDIYTKKIQQGNNLGETMQNAFKESFDQGFNEVVIIGSDCVEISEEHLLNAYTHFENYDVVIGPAVDGGYYLIGLKEIHINIFSNILWSTETVLAQTLRLCAIEKLSVYLLPELSDIDEEKDIKEEHKKILQFI